MSDELKPPGRGSSPAERERMMALLDFADAQLRRDEELLARERQRVLGAVYREISATRYANVQAERVSDPEAERDRLARLRGQEDRKKLRQLCERNNAAIPPHTCTAKARSARARTAR